VSAAVAHAGPAVDTDLLTRAATGDQQAWNQLVERYIPLIWSICRRHQLGDADAARVSQRLWRHLAAQLDTIRDPAGLAGWLAAATRRECLRMATAARESPAAGSAPDAGPIPDAQARTAEQELLAAEQQAVLREAFLDLPPCGQQLIALLTEDPPVPDAEISARLGIPAGRIGPDRRRYLDQLRRHPALAALINAGANTADDRRGQAVTR
jgi:RNA polymerase sigma factor (sigma-70 family)